MLNVNIIISSVTSKPLAPLVPQLPPLLAGGRPLLTQVPPQVGLGMGMAKAVVIITGVGGVQTLGVLPRDKGGTEGVGPLNKDRAGHYNRLSHPWYYFEFYSFRQSRIEMSPISR